MNRNFMIMDDCQSSPMSEEMKNLYLKGRHNGIMLFPSRPQKLIKSKLFDNPDKCPEIDKLNGYLIRDNQGIDEHNRLLDQLYK